MKAGPKALLSDSGSINYFVASTETFRNSLSAFSISKDALRAREYYFETSHISTPFPVTSALATVIAFPV